MQNLKLMHYFGNVVFFILGSLRQDRVGETITKCARKHLTWREYKVRVECKSQENERESRSYLKKYNE